MRNFLKILILGGLLSYSNLLSADSLVNKQTGQIVDLGHARIDNGTIHWKPCFSEDTKDYSTAEYRVKVGESCLPLSDRLPPVLPKTASPLPLIGLLGCLFVAVGLITRIFRKTPLHNRVGS